MIRLAHRMIKRTVHSLIEDRERLVRTLLDCQAGALVTSSERERQQIEETIKLRIEQIDRDMEKMGSA